jgi:HSP20 family molecular chaperone IbpA
MEALAARRASISGKSAASRVADPDASSGQGSFRRPRYRCHEHAGALRLVVRVPGADPAGINLEVNAPDLTITAARDRSMRPAGRSSPLAEAIHHYQLRLRLGFSLAYDALRAELHGSTLIVTIPKRRRRGLSFSHTRNAVSRAVCV